MKHEKKNLKTITEGMNKTTNTKGYTAGQA